MQADDKDDEAATTTISNSDFSEHWRKRTSLICLLKMDEPLEAKNNAVLR